MRKALAVLCILHAICQPVKADAADKRVSPVIEFDRTVFLIGEQIPFRVGKTAAVAVEVEKLTLDSCVLSVTSPEGKLTVQKKYQFNGYDGPSRTSSLTYNEILNELDAHLSSGSYQLVLSCGNERASAKIQIRPNTALSEIQATFDFPAAATLKPNVPFPVTLTLRNGGTGPVTFVSPETNYWANVIAYAKDCDSSRIPFWMRLENSAENEKIKNDGYRYRLEPVAANLLKLTLHRLNPGESFSLTFSFQKADIGSRDLPAEAQKEIDGQEKEFEHEFGIVAGTALPAFRGDAPIDASNTATLLFRSSAHYVDGKKETWSCSTSDEFKGWTNAARIPGS